MLTSQNERGLLLACFVVGLGGKGYGGRVMGEGGWLWGRVTGEGGGGRVTGGGGGGGGGGGRRLWSNIMTLPGRRLRSNIMTLPVTRLEVCNGTPTPRGVLQNTHT